MSVLNQLVASKMRKSSYRDIGVGGDSVHSNTMLLWVSILVLGLVLIVTQVMAQQASFSISVFPTIVHSKETVRLYNTDLTQGVVSEANLCMLDGSVVEDFVERIAQRRRGI